nr:IS30 family transposase [Sulfurimonas sp. SAG-AH-194-L11]
MARGTIIDRVMIDKRPKIVEKKSRIGEREVDTIIGKNHHQAIVTLVDRNSKFTLMKKLEAKQARVVTDTIVHLLKPIQNYAHTITSDNGKEFSYHEQIVEVQNKLNRRPRKILAYKTPAEVFFDTIMKSYVVV